MEIAFLLVMAAATTVTVPVVGTFLMFSLMVAPSGAARCFTSRPHVAVALSVSIALVTVWLAIVASYDTNWPIGFFVGAFGALSYGSGRCWLAWRRSRVSRAGAAVSAVAWRRS
jgi:zinc/manganese transport system permease protein